jgi:2'-phosphotransferase
LQLEHPKLKSQGLNLEGIKAIVKADSKQRYDLILENSDGLKLGAISSGPISPMSEVDPTASSLLSGKEPVTDGTSSGEITNDKKDIIWLIKARQGHSIKVLS